MKKIIVTLGPATNSLDAVKKIKSRKVDFVRINMSHSDIDDLKYYIGLSKQAGIPFIIDTEGSQIRTGPLSSDLIFYGESQTVKIYNDGRIGDLNEISLKPEGIIDQLKVGDIVYVDFDTLAIRISSTEFLKKGYVESKIITAGNLGSNKGIVIDSREKRHINLPTLSSKDIQAIELGIEKGISYLAASFIRSKQAVDFVREISNNKMKIISKIECLDALENLDEIILASDYLLIDRGDLSKEIPIEKIPFAQKIILNHAKNADTPVFVATNLLESMITNRKPTRAEVHDIINTIVDGAFGLTLAAETAIGKHPIACINMLNKIIHHAELAINDNEIIDKEENFVRYLEKTNYLFDSENTSSIIKPHGGKLIDKLCLINEDKSYYKDFPSVKLNNNQQSDLEKIATGVYSPLKGYMDKEELESVLNNMRLPNNIIWTIPILLDISKEVAINIQENDKVVLLDINNEIIGLLHVSEKFQYDKKIIINKIYGDVVIDHPGAKLIDNMNPVFLGGEIELYKLQQSEYSQYDLTPKQTRRLFNEKNWTKVVGFHTRNAIHMAHEFIQVSGMKKGDCDGLFLHPVVGMKKTNDYKSSIIIKSYEIMQKEYYKEDKTVFGVFSTYSRYAGPREAVFTAICRQNYGCSHFIVGRDHTGIGNKNINIKNDIFASFKDLAIKIVKFNKVYYSKRSKKYIEQSNVLDIKDDDKMEISGSEARKIFQSGKCPPKWYMRPKISKMIMDSINFKMDVFV